MSLSTAPGIDSGPTSKTQIDEGFLCVLCELFAFSALKAFKRWARVDSRERRKEHVNGGTEWQRKLQHYPRRELLFQPE